MEWNTCIKCKKRKSTKKRKSSVEAADAPAFDPAKLGQITLSATTNLGVGMAVTGNAGVPVGAYVTAIDTATNVVTLSERLDGAVGTFKLLTSGMARAPFTQTTAAAAGIAKLEGDSIIRNS